MKITAEIKSYFEQHKGVNEFFFTSNGSAFFKESDAMNTANNLKASKQDGTITKITRDEAFAEVSASDGSQSEGRNGAGAAGSETPVKTAQQLLDEAQAAYDKAVADKVADEVIADLKKALTVAKAKATREANKA